ncbi:hypothetical protein CsSME_00028767 [Camellia sinensis var. sinensis]|uniref:Uncharacterized protein n=1 Tax=Camellia lanceoleosa TaxID=1840588 RepID=A0ACC0GXG1_9ERIC|nr:alpha-soluble NSF attachment protein-like [Camellia sinensis]KAI8005898.1 hypothetical protein LOK49_LG07G00799 [Camellia lanceoleosa]
MADQIARGEELEKKAEKKLNGWGLFSSKYEDAADLFDKAANSFKLAKSWDQAGSAYVKLANCYIKSDSKHEAASAYADAAHCYKKTNTKESISCLEQAANFFKENGKLNMSARYYKEIAELCEAEQNFEQAIDYYERAADLFDSEEVTTSANQCKQKIAQFAAQLEQYQKSIEIYEFIAQKSLNNNLLKYGVKGHLLNAGICQLCKGKGDVVAISNALERYQDMDPTFSGTREYRLLADLADAIDQEDVAKFTDAVKEFDSMTQLDAWKTTLLLRVKEALKAKELEEDDLT